MAEATSVFLDGLHRPLRNSLGTLIGLTVSKTSLPRLGVGNLPGPRLQLENSRLEEIPGSSEVASEITQDRSYQPAYKH